jgi:NADH:ubiquinone oxidoreductase subunit 6 (subunit J)
MVIASELIKWSALWKIIVAALVGGAGVVTAFGILLVGLKWAKRPRSSGAKLGGYSLAAICGVFCVAAVVVGVYAMAHKPKPKPATPTKSALIVSAGRTRS